MFVKKISLKDYRNYRKLDVEFSEKVNVIVGDNGVGKTNLVEAIYYLNLARSFKEISGGELIRYGEKRAFIHAEIISEGVKSDIDCLIEPNSKKITVNGKRIEKISALSRIINIISFEPKDAFLFVDSPSRRRNFLDVTLMKQYPEYIELLINYEKILKERNFLLKNDDVDLVMLDVITSQLIGYAIKIINYRQKIALKINEIISKVITHIKGENERLTLVYIPFSGNIELSEENLRTCYEKSLVNDLKKKMTTIGIQREDFTLLLNGKDIALHGSQGENRLASISLKLTPYFLVENKKNRPIVILDDVMSELDKKHQINLYQFLLKLGQVFVTTVSSKERDAITYEIKNNQIKRR